MENGIEVKTKIDRYQTEQRVTIQSKDIKPQKTPLQK